MKQNLILICIYIIFTAGLAHSKQEQVCFKENCFSVELADSLYEHSRGLMFRKQMDLDKGMLFIFKEEKRRSFWMKNTLIPLDIIWINKDKKVVFISRNSQPCKKDACPLITPDKRAQYVLELNGGISDKIGLKEGDKIKIELD
jgi:uncharacterized membrane protein (UPF0127 family)